MYPRTNYEMTKADLKKILDACQPVPYIMVGGFAPLSQQERANEAWAELGKRMGFDSTTVQPTVKGARFFTAVPSETKEQQTARLAHEVETKKQQEIDTLRKEIADRKARLAVHGIVE